jgi:hypothetical protein
MGGRRKKNFTARKRVPTLFTDVPLEKLKLLHELIMIRDSIYYINSALITMSEQEIKDCIMFIYTFMIIWYDLFLMHATVTS